MRFVFYFLFSVVLFISSMQVSLCVYIYRLNKVITISAGADGGEQLPLEFRGVGADV